MKKTGKSVLTVLIIAGVVTLIVAKLFGNKEAVAAKIYQKNPNARIMVNVDTAANRPLNVTKEYLGSFDANRDVTISAETQGRVIAGNIREGDLISAGTLIAQIDNVGLRAQRFSAQASFNNAKANLERYQNASVGEGVSQMQVDEQKLTLESARAQLQQIDKQVSQSRILAPFSGNVTSKSFELGTFVAPGTKLLEIVDISKVKLAINVPEAEVAFFAKGKKIKVHTDVYPDAKFNGIVDELISKADATHNYPVKITVINDQANRLLPGMYGKVNKDDQLNRSALTINRSALLGSAKIPQVFVIKNGEAQLVSISTGRSNDKLIEVTGGISAGDIVVTSGQVNLSNGIKVAAIK